MAHTNEDLDAVAEAPSNNREMQDILHDLFHGLEYASFDARSPRSTATTSRRP